MASNHPFQYALAIAVALSCASAQAQEERRRPGDRAERQAVPPYPDLGKNSRPRRRPANDQDRRQHGGREQDQPEGRNGYVQRPLQRVASISHRNERLRRTAS